MRIAGLLPFLVLCLTDLTFLPSQAAERLVVVGGAATEIVHALGAGGQIVGTDTTSTWPDVVKALPKVGYVRTLSAEGILSLRPSLVLGIEDSGPPTVIEQLRAAGTPVVILPGRNDIAGLRTRIASIGEALGLTAKAQELQTQIDAKLTKIERALAQTPRKPKILTLISMGGGTMQVAGLETGADAIVKLAGGENAVTLYRGYRPFSPEAILSAAPDFILTTTDSLAQFGGLASLQNHPVLKLTPAIVKEQVVAMDATELLGFGPRLPQTLASLIEKFHPGLKGY